MGWLSFDELLSSSFSSFLLFLLQTKLAEDLFSECVCVCFFLFSEGLLLRLIKKEHFSACTSSVAFPNVEVLADEKAVFGPAAKCLQQEPIASGPA